MPEIITRRSFLRVLTGIIAAPAIIQVSSLMPLRGEALIGDGIALKTIPHPWMEFPWDDPHWEPRADYYETLEEWGEMTRIGAKLFYREHGDPRMQTGTNHG